MRQKMCFILNVLYKREIELRKIILRSSIAHCQLQM